MTVFGLHVPPCQVALFFTSLPAAYLAASTTPRVRRWAFVFGVAGQPFWLWSAWSAGQWGSFLLCTFYSFNWARGLYNHWLRADAAGGIMTGSEESRPQPEVVGRVGLTPELVRVGDAEFDRKRLAAEWGPWGQVESALRGLVPPATRAELDHLAGVPATRAGRNGYSETLQAVAQATG